jgi:multiple sugar transport system permease protein
MTGRAVSERRAAAGFIGPAAFMVLAVAFYPLARNLVASFQSISLKAPELYDSFVGMRNFSDIFGDARFWRASINTAVFTVASVGLEFVLGLAAALSLQRLFRRSSLLLLPVLLPWMVPTVVSAQMWKWMFNDSFGFANKLLLSFGVIGGFKAWLADPVWAFVLVVMADVWKTTPFVAMLLFAGLRSIPDELYEAAEIDGAGTFSKFRSITIPMLLSTIGVVLILRSIDAFRVFDVVYVMTQGGPGNSTEVLSMLAYKTAFGALDVGRGAAVATVVTVMVLILSLFYRRVLGMQREGSGREGF